MTSSNHFVWVRPGLLSLSGAGLQPSCGCMLSVSSLLSTLPLAAYCALKRRGVSIGRTATKKAGRASLVASSSPAPAFRNTGTSAACCSRTCSAASASSISAVVMATGMARMLGGVQFGRLVARDEIALDGTYGLCSADRDRCGGTR